MTEKYNYCDFEMMAACRAVEAQPEQEPVACKHEWFRTGAMEPRECRCIKCGAWNTTPPQRPEERNFCERCGKRTADLTTIHTCTPPQEKNA